MMRKHSLPYIKLLVINIGNFSGIMNMKIDNWIYENSKLFIKNLEEELIVRFYNFTNHTVTLGYFQKNAINEIKNIDEYKNWSIVRRITGGKAVFHYPKKDLVLCAVGYTKILEKIDNLFNLNHNKINKVHTFFNNILWESVIPQNNYHELIKNYTLIQSENNIQQTIKKLDCFQNSLSFEKTFEGKKIIGTAIKISQTNDSEKFILQANIKLQNLYNQINREVFKNIKNNFINHFKDYKEIILNDFISILKYSKNNFSFEPVYN